jgi:hypothetical protein
MMNQLKSLKFYEKVIIIFAHLFMLGWMIYVLKEGGHFEMATLAWHFVGLSIYGGLLIRTSAWLAMRRFRLESRRQ